MLYGKIEAVIVSAHRVVMGISEITHEAKFLEHSMYSINVSYDYF